MTEPSVPSEEDYPRWRETWWPMLLMFCASNIYSIDRGIVGVLAEQIRAAFAITDIQMGLLLGLAYTLLSGFLGVVFGYLVDRNVRRTIVACSIILWSLSTIAGGLAPNFNSFFGFRAVVGLGEAALAPSAISLIADMFAPKRRGRAIGAYLFGATIGSALSAIIPGAILGAGVHLHLPGFGLLAPWRSTFVLCGAVGPIVGLLMLTVKEPARRGAQGGRDGASPTLGESLAYLWRKRGVMGFLYAGFCLHYIAFTGVTVWTAAFLARVYHTSLSHFAGQLGLMLLVAGGGGYLVGGLAVDAAAARGAEGRVGLLAVLPMAALPGVLAGLAPSVTVALVMLTALSFATPIMNVAMNGAFQDLMPNRMRGFSYSLLSVVGALPAGVGGPLAIAYVTEHLGADPALIGRSFVIVGLPALFASTTCFVLAWRALRASSRNGPTGGATPYNLAGKPEPP